MSLEIPASPAGPKGTYFERPSDYSSALDSARSLLKELETSSEWEEMPAREEVELSKIVDTVDAAAMPITRGSTLVENATPQQVLAALQLPGIRKKWDPRLDEGHAVRRFSQTSYEVYSVMKSPSYFIWARDIVACQETWWGEKAEDALLVQVSVTDDERLPEAGSYQKSRTRATVDLSGWKLEKSGNDTKITYVVKVALNGSIPTAVAQTLALETPMCVGRVRDVYYQNGHVPYDVTPANSPESKPETMKTVSVTQTFEDDDDEKRWTGYYAAQGAETFAIAYDGERMYASGVNVSVASAEDNDVSAIEATVDEANKVIKVKVPDSIAQGTTFEIVTVPQ